MKSTMHSVTYGEQIVVRSKFPLETLPVILEKQCKAEYAHLTLKLFPRSNSPRECAGEVGAERNGRIVARFCFWNSQSIAYLSGRYNQTDHLFQIDTDVQIGAGPEAPVFVGWSVEDKPLFARLKIIGSFTTDESRKALCDAGVTDHWVADLIEKSYLHLENPLSLLRRLYPLQCWLFNHRSEGSLGQRKIWINIDPNGRGITSGRWQ